MAPLQAVILASRCHRKAWTSEETHLRCPYTPPGAIRTAGDRKIVETFRENCTSIDKISWQLGMNSMSWRARHSHLRPRLQLPRSRHRMGHLCIQGSAFTYPMRRTPVL